MTYPATDYVLDDRTVVRAALESYAYDDATTDGSTALSYEDVNIFDAFDPVQHEQEVLTFDRAKDSLSPDGVSPLEAFTSLSFKTFMYGSGSFSAPPGWAKLFMPACGFGMSSVGGTALTAPSAAAASSTPTTALANVAYKYIVTDVDLATGNESAAHASAVSVTPTLGQKVTLTFNATVPSGHKYRIYRSKGGETTPLYLLAESAAGATTFVDQSGVYDGVPYRTAPPSGGTVTAGTADGLLDYTRTVPTSAANSANVLTLLNEDFNSLNFLVWLNSHKVPAGGARGNFEAMWEAGRPCEQNFNMRGIYHARVSGAANENPTGSCVDPGPPPNVINVSPVFYTRSPNSTWTTDLGNGAGASVLDGSSILPYEIKSCKWTPGIELDNRRSASSAQAVKEVIIGRKRTGASVDIVVEVDRDFAWDAVADFKAGCRFGFRYTIAPEAGSTTFRRIEQGFPNMQIRSAPRLVREDGAIRCWSLSFVPLDLLSCNDSMQTRLY